jgi:glucose/arabinose dehydrogenase
MRPVLRRVGMVAAAVTAALAVAAPAADAARLHPVMSGLGEPTYVTGHGGNLYVVLRRGVIRVRHGGRLLARPFLDISRHVTTAGGEQGLLSMAFAPHFNRSHRVYVDFTNLNGDTRVVQYRTFAGNRNRVNPATKRVLLKVAQPFDNHNGGQLQIGPDGLLYISLGDGGSAGDPNLNGQSKGPLATILRMDPTKAHPRAAMYAYGLRNPWRFTFDKKTGGMWIGDVGQDTWEEVDHLRHDTPRGTNFGWSFYEGRSVFKNQPIDRSRLRFPVAVYRHVVAGSDNCSVTGGYVYRGSAIPRLVGQYLYADFCSGRIWKIPSRGGRPKLTNMSFKASSISSFGQGSNGELYVVSLGGTIYKIVP